MSPSGSAFRLRAELPGWVVPAHVGGMVVLTAWTFGGQTPWMREWLTLWSLGGGLAIALATVASRGRAGGRGLRRYLGLLWPLWAYQALVIASLFNPVFEAHTIAGVPVLARRDTVPWLPVCAQPEPALRDLALFSGIVIGAFNLWWAVSERRTLRWIALLLAANAAALAVFGTVQKLADAGYYFGRVVSPNLKFFATFIYHNHWGAFALLALGAAVGLLFQAARHHGRGFWGSPAVAGLAATLVLAASLPMAASRSATALGIVMAVAALGQGVAWLARHRRRAGRGAVLPFAVAALALAVAVAAIATLARPVFAGRLAQTRQQVADLRAGNWVAVDDRPAVYRSTLNMIAARPWTGWGLESFGKVFPLYRDPRIVGIHYEHAHSDWLQAVAESGVAGATLLALLAIRFLRRVSWRRLGPLPAWLLGGCAIVFAYAALEFPFANPAVQAAWWCAFFAALRWIRLDEAHHGAASPAREPSPRP